MSVLSAPDELNLGPPRHGGKPVMIAVVALIVGAAGGYVLRSGTEESTTMPKTVTQTVSASAMTSGFVGSVYFDGKQGVYIGPTQLTIGTRGTRWELGFTSTVENGRLSLAILQSVPNWETFSRDAAAGNWPPPYAPGGSYFSADPGSIRGLVRLTEPGVYGMYCSRGEMVDGRPYFAVAMIHVRKS
jgi:hypothetical protein